MQANCPSECQPGYKCSCGELLCDHMILNHAIQGHSPAPLTEADQMNEVFRMISHKKQELIQLSTFIIPELKRLTSEQLSLLTELETSLAESKSTIPSTINQLSRIKPGLLNQLIDQSGFKDQLNEAQKKTEELNQQLQVKDQMIQELEIFNNETTQSKKRLKNSMKPRRRVRS